MDDNERHIPPDDQDALIDDVNLAILSELSRNPFAGDKELRPKVNLEKSAFDERLQKLRAGGYLTLRQRFVDLAKTNRWFRYRIDITIDPRELRKSSNDQFSALGAHYKTDNPQERLAFYIRDVVAKRYEQIIVEEISILLGNPADLCATVLVPNHRTIFAFITKEIRTLAEVASTSTSHVSWRIFRDPESEAQEPTKKDEGKLISRVGS